MLRNYRLAIAVQGLVAVVGFAAAAPARADDKPPETQLCLENRSIRAKDVSAEHGYFARTPQGWWRNTGPACSAYGPNRALLTRSIENRQCRGDVVVVFDPFTRIEYGACPLGAWERVDAPPKD
jgi:hypothetical protein